MGTHLFGETIGMSEKQSETVRPSIVEGISEVSIRAVPQDLGACAGVQRTPRILKGLESFGSVMASLGLGGRWGMRGREGSVFCGA